MPRVQLLEGPQEHLKVRTVGLVSVFRHGEVVARTRRRPATLEQAALMGERLRRACALGLVSSSDPPYRDIVR